MEPELQQHPQEKEELQAWNLLMQAVRNSSTDLKNLQMGPAFEIINITHDNCCWIEEPCLPYLLQDD